MNSAQVHLALTHVPVILSLVGLMILIVALLKKNTTLTTTSYIVILIAGLGVLPVFFSGEGTEEAVENAPGVSEALIERHEKVAKLAMISIVSAGMLALAALFSFRWISFARVLRVVVLLLAITSGGLMVQTAHLGGQIRHTEIRYNIAAQDEKNAAGENQTHRNNDQQQETNDD
jgi:small-conductance mechanosensitive channel